MLDNLIFFYFLLNFLFNRIITLFLETRSLIFGKNTSSKKAQSDNISHTWIVFGDNRYDSKQYWLWINDIK